MSLSILDGRRSQVDDGASPADVATNAGPSFTFPRSLSGKKALSERRNREKSHVSAADVAGIALSLSDRRNESSQARDRALANPEAEIKRRKAARRARRIGGLACAFTACALAVAFAAYSFMGAYETRQEHKSLLSQGFDELVSADDVVLSADTLVTSSFDDADAGDMQACIAQFDDARVRLSGAQVYAASSKEGVSGTDADAADQLNQAADARKDMLELADAILREELAAKQAAQTMAKCWEALLSADNLSREAASLVAETNEENTRASQEKSEQALQELEEAQRLLVQAQTHYAADYQAVSDYISKRKEAIEYAIASDEAIYLQDKSTAESNNDLYNAADKQAAELGASLPQDAAEPIRKMLENSLAPARSDYMGQRSRAAAADAFIRDYLGVRD